MGKRSKGMSKDRSGIDLTYSAIVWLRALPDDIRAEHYEAAILSATSKGLTSTGDISEYVLYIEELYKQYVSIYLSANHASEKK